MRNKNCISCGKTLRSALGSDWEQDPPQGAVVFIATGNYGSTIYDPMFYGSEHLKIAICDTCLTKAAKRDYVIHVQPIKVPTTEKVWKINEDD